MNFPAPLVPGTLLVIDEDLNPRIAHDLRQRGRHALSCAQLGLRGSKDPQMIPALFARFPTCVLVTGDDKMPGEHPTEIALACGTVATVTGRRPKAYADDQEYWEREIIQRWAHKMQEQALQTVMRYGSAGPRRWTQRRWR